MARSILEFLSSIGEEVVDAEEESFLLFSRDIPSNNLGFVDSRASTIELNIHSRDYTIHQSPTLLSSTRDGGTTGAVLWKITPLFSEWISSASTNPFWTDKLGSADEHILGPSARVIELGCGISGLVALTLAPLVHIYIATDQEYVRKYFRKNIDENWDVVSSSLSRKGSRYNKARRDSPKDTDTNIKFVPLDWELDIPSNDLLLDDTTTAATKDERTPPPGFDILISCDCIYNEALIPSFVRTCADVCALRSSSSLSSFSRTRGENRSETGAIPTIAIIAQQQRSPDVFETWLRETLRGFRVWRIEDFGLTSSSDTKVLGEGSGYVVHALVLRSELSDE